MLELLKKNKIVAIFRGISLEDSAPAANALYHGGVRLMETTMNSENAVKIIPHMRRALPGDAFVGAGTVINLTLAREAITAGAQFIVTPNVNLEVIKYCVENKVPVFPGAMTPTEILTAWEAGSTAVKLFPMGALGISYFKEILGPLSHIPMVLTGGIDLENMHEFVRLGAAGFGIGGNLLRKDLVAAGRFDELQALAGKYVHAAGKL